MRIAIGMLAQEVNAFSPVATTLRDFEVEGILFGPQVVERGTARNDLRGFIMAAQAAGGIELVGAMAASAVPSGKLDRATHGYLKNELLQRLRQAGPVDGILLALHGAMEAEGESDVEGDLLSAIRDEWGPKVGVAVSLDHHANMTRKMMQSVDALVGYHRQPHSDGFETGKKAAEMLIGALRGRIRPVIRWRKLPMIASGNLLVPDGPLGPFFAEAEALEAQGKVVSISIFPEFPWGDTPELGWTVVAITDNDPIAAQAIADDLAKRIWEKRCEFMPTDRPTPAQAVRHAIESDGGPYVLADYGDNMLAGAPGDGTAVLRELLTQPLNGAALLSVLDPDAVAAAIAAGVGAEITLEVGGKRDHVYSQPVRVTGRVKVLTDGRYLMSSGPRQGQELTMGRAALLQSGRVNIVLHELPCGNLDPGFYRSFGLEPRDAKIVLAKTAYNLRPRYEPIARELIVLNSPGFSSDDLKAMEPMYRLAPRPMFPLDDDARFEL